MKTRNFKWLVVLCMTLGFASVAKAQINCNEVYFYAEAGNSEIYDAVKFDYSKNRVLRIKTAGTQHVKNRLAESKNYYENLTASGKNEGKDGDDSFSEYKYDAQKSTSSKIVYRKTESYIVYPTNAVGLPIYTLPATTKNSYAYLEFSTDPNISSFILRYENDDHKTSTPRYYTRVPKEDLLPKSTNYDFLND